MPSNRAKPQSKAPIMMIGLGAVLIIIVLIWIAINNVPQNSSPTAAAAIPYPNIQRVTLSDAKAAYDGKTALFLDVRDADSYKAGHIPGAVNIPLANLQNQVNDLKTDQWIITYCT